LAAHFWLALDPGLIHAGILGHQHFSLYFRLDFIMDFRLAWISGWPIFRLAWILGQPKMILT
jgi:hypothetical protein